MHGSGSLLLALSKVESEWRLIVRQERLDRRLFFAGQFDTHCIADSQ